MAQQGQSSPGYDIGLSASSAAPSTSSIGATQFGTVTIGQGQGGSAATAPNAKATNGISWLTVGVVGVAAILIVWLFKR